MDLRGQASLVGTEKLPRELLFLLMELTLKLMKSQMQITTVIYCSGTFSLIF